ncbi:MAG: competence/damage-inducible protein A [Planctomycetota bacterium]
MKAEIISVGDELTSGQRLDTNSQLISRRLGDLGISVRHHTTVGDELADNIAAFRIAAERSDIVIISGGLGPTADDLTREAMSEAFGYPLEFRPEAMEHIENLFKTRNRPMPERNRVQAMFPETSRIIPNPHGTAPGIDLSVAMGNSGTEHRCRLFALPGVPAEMVQMLSQTVEHRLIAELGVGNSRWYYHSIKLFGLGESDVEKVIPDLIARDRVPRVGITVSKATITLRIAAQAASEPEFRLAIQDTVEQIHNAFGDVIFAEGEMELNDVVQNLLAEQKHTLSIIEVGAGSWIGQMLSEGFEPSEDSGLKHLSWLPTFSSSGDPKWLAKLALNSKAAHATDYAMAVGIYPALSEFSQETSLPTTKLKVAIVDPQGEVMEKSQRVSGHPELFYQRLAKTALDLLRRELLGE